MDISKSKEYQSSLRACERISGKGTFCYGSTSTQVFPEHLIKDAAQDVYNRLSGHGLSRGAIVLILNIVDCELRFQSECTEL